jgi:hypothetical protein
VSVAGLKVKTGAVVSGGGGGVIVTVRVAVPVLPAASPAVAVHTLVVFSVTAAAVKVFVVTAKLPPLVHVTVGPEVTRRLSVAVNVAVPVASDCTDNVAGLNATTGETVSAIGVVDVVLPPLLPLPPQPDKSKTDAKDSVEREIRLK